MIFFYISTLASYALNLMVNGNLYSDVTKAKSRFFKKGKNYFARRNGQHDSVSSFKKKKKDY